MLEPLEVPASAAGPDLRRLIIGSEGTLGVITHASVKVHPLPPARWYGVYAFPDFPSGLAAIRAMIHLGIRPTVLRLSDAEETRVMFRLGTDPSHLSGRAKIAAARTWLALRRAPMGRACFMILGFDGRRREVEAIRAEAGLRLKLRGAVYLGQSAGQKWLAERFEHPYLRDEFLDRGILVDTLETATTWSKAESLHASVRNAIESAVVRDGSGAIVMCHASHAYEEGVSLYFTFLGKQREGDELTQWLEVKRAASDAIARAGATISHHHGIGADHRAWMGSEVGRDGLRVLRALKAELDPATIMNPGKLIPPTS